VRNSVTIASPIGPGVLRVQLGEEPHAEGDVALLVLRDLVHPLPEARQEVELLERALDHVLAGLG
jgi:hypothetical protein